MKMRIFLIALTAFALIFSSCKRDDFNQEQETPNPDNATSMNDLQIPDGFEFATTLDRTFTVYTKTSDNKAIANVKVSIFNGASAEGGKLLASGATDQNGVLIIERSIPASLKEVFVETDYIGLPRSIAALTSDENIVVTLGGPRLPQMKSSAIPFKTTDATFVPMGTFNYQGLPSYLENPGDVVDQAFLNDINASFPEGYAVPQYHPEYMDLENNFDFLLNEACDVWITFVHEGAGYKNVLGYYTYPLGNPPATPEDIEQINVIFPNVSFQGSGGSLITGDKVYLGEFDANTALGWVIVANGFSNGNINTNRPIYYSNPDLNPESNINKRQHVVTLVDNGRDVFLLGFEDLPREGGSDDDFNDAMFYVTANPITAVDQSGYPPVTYTEDDEDGDGVSDNFDDYPTDPNKAFNNYYPAEGTWGTLAYEDLWPSKGDYDFNDMVIGYNVNQITNADNEVVEIDANYKLRAMGASFKNGFGFQLNVAPSAISSVSGIDVSGDLVSLNANNTEAGQSKAVIILFENGYRVMPHPSDGFIGVNTTLGSSDVASVEFDVNIVLASPVELSVMGVPPYNPFIFSNKIRSQEIHLADKMPTDLANTEQFGMYDDDSNPATGKYYRTSTNLPWAIHLTEEFDYPKEKAAIIDAYNFFSDWAQSGGVDNPDWYSDAPGFRNSTNIFN